MSASYGAVSVGSTATQILPADPGRRGFLISNNGGQIIYIGFDASVTTSTGIQILPQDKFDQIGEHGAYRGAIYGITASSTSDCRFWEWTP